MPSKQKNIHYTVIKCIEFILRYPSTKSFSRGNGEGGKNKFKKIFFARCSPPHVSLFVCLHAWMSRIPFWNFHRKITYPENEKNFSRCYAAALAFLTVLCLVVPRLMVRTNAMG